MSPGSRIFVPNRSIGYVSNHIPLQVRYIKSRKENLITTCVGKAFHTYGISHFSLLSVGSLHPNDINCMAADTYHIYTACDNIIYAWRRGTELKHKYASHDTNVYLLLPFGPHLISIDRNGHLKLWNIKQETVQMELDFSNDHFQVSCIIHPSTYVNKVLMGSAQGSMQLWNMNTAKLIYTFKGWKSGVNCLQQAPALDVVAVGLNSGRIVLHNLKYDETVMEFMQDWGMVTCISFRTDGPPIMATGSVNGHVTFWNLEERRVSSHLLKAHDDVVTGMVFLPNEPLIVTSSPDNSLKCWIFDMSDGGARLLKLREGHSQSPTFVRFHGANAHNILSCAGDSSLRIFNTKTEQFNKSLGKASYNRKSSKKRGRLVEDPLVMPPIIEFTSETTREKEWDNIAAIHSGLPVVTTWSYDKKKMSDIKLVADFKNKQSNSSVAATCVCLTHCGNFVLTGYSNGNVKRFNIQSGILRGSYGNLVAHDCSVMGVATDSLNQIVVSGGADGTLKFWPFKCKEENPLSILNLNEPVRFVRTHRESSMLAVAMEDFSIFIVDIDSRKVVRKFFGHTGLLCDASFSPDSRWLVSCAMDCTIRTWDIPSGQLVDQFQMDEPCISLNLSPTGETMVTVHVGNLGISLWTNRTLYSRITLTAISAEDEVPHIVLPSIVNDEEYKEEITPIDSSFKYRSPEQIGDNLTTLSGLATSRWQNLLNIDIIKQRNKPKSVRKPQSAPFFLPTLASLDFKFDLTDAQDENTNKSVQSKPIIDDLVTSFGKMLLHARTDDDFSPVISKLKEMGPSTIEFEIQSLDSIHSTQSLEQFMKTIIHMFESNRDFELAQAYLGVCLKLHGNTIAKSRELKKLMADIQNLIWHRWNKLQETIFYSLSIVQTLKNM